MVRQGRESHLKFTESTADGSHGIPSSIFLPKHPG